MASPLSGVATTDVGQGYDVAIGFDNGTTIKMIGYTLQPGTQWQESTDIQDEEHLVQISTNQTDRYSRYPKVSQGDWSGGERQTFFIDPTKYFSSNGGINVTVPGQLQSFAGRQSQVFTGGSGGAAPAATDGTSVWIIYNQAATCNLVIGSTLVAGGNFAKKLNGTFATANDVIAGSEFFNNSALVSSAGVLHGIWRVDNTGATISQYTNDLQGATLPSMAFFNDKVYYSSGGGTALSFVPLATPAGAAAGTTAFTPATGNNSSVGCLVSTATNLYFITSVPNTSFASSNSTIWSHDGTTTTRLGIVPGTPIGGGSVNGIVYYIFSMPQDFTQQGFSNVFGGYVVYQVDGTTLSIFDDFRAVDVSFQSKNQSAPSLPMGNVVGDGRYLFLSMPGFSVKAYDLLTPGNPVSQYGPFVADTGAIPSTFSNLSVLAGSTSTLASVVQVQMDGQGVLNVSQTGGGSMLGVITMSYMDFGAPDDVKLMQKVFIDLVAPLADTFTNYQPVQAGYRIDNQTAFTPLTIQVNAATGNLFAYFPANTKAARIQLQITLQQSNAGATSGLSPVVRSVSMKATLGRSWTFTLAADRNQRLRNQGTSAGEDTQGSNAQAKLANVLNAYRQSGGDVVMFVPSPTQANGVEQVNAVIQDYKYGSNTQIGPYNTEYGNFDMEGTLQLTVTETL